MFVPKLKAMTVFKNCFLLLLLSTLTLSISAQVLQPNTKPNPKVNYERLKRIDAVINEFVQQNKIIGAVTLLVKDGQVVQHQAYGIDDVETKKPMPKDGIFRIASQTKALTTVGIMMLMEDGKLLLNDPVSKYIPEFAKPVVLATFNEKDSSYTTVPAKREITIKDLLTHTSGLGYAGIGSPTMQAIYAKNRITGGVGEMTNEIDATMKRLAKLPLEVQPGEKWNYSLSTDVLGHVIEIISGMDLEAFFQKRICVPLGMKDTYFNLPAEKHARLTAIYTPDSTGRLKKWANGLGIPADFPNIKKSYFSGGGGLVSTAYDYAIFLQMLLNKGTYNGITLLSPRSVELMTSNQVGALFGSGAFGLGFRIVTPAMSDELSNVGSFAWGGAFSTTYWVDPKAQLIGLFMTQQFPGTPAISELQGKFKVAVYQSLR